jgi:hypothetical protein
MMWPGLDRLQHDVASTLRAHPPLAGVCRGRCALMSYAHSCVSPGHGQAGAGPA